jgi:hypothetical protein
MVVQQAIMYSGSTDTGIGTVSNTVGDNSSLKSQLCLRKVRGYKSIFEEERGDKIIGGGSV